MKLSVQTVAALVALFSAAQPCTAASQHGHQHIGRRHSHAHDSSSSSSSSNVTEQIELKTIELKARGLDTCTFPSSDGLVAITPSGDNAGWAMSPDQPCTCGSYCPYACPPGQVSAQWKDGSTYATTDRMAGGLFCGLDGKPVKPFSNKDYCVDGTGTVQAVNNVGEVVSFCQTVLPGNEDILIPTDVYGTETLAVPDTSYWQATASHFYINPPGVNSDTGCHWGDSSTPIGNWAPYVAGANTDAAGLTYVKLGLNPIWQSSDLFSTKPTFGLKIECPSGGCNGLPCSMDGDGVTSDLKATGAGGSDFCVVTVPKGGKANIVIYNLDGSTGSATSSEAATSSKAEPTTTSSPTSTTSTSTTSTTSTTSSKPSTTSTTSPTSTSTSTSTSASRTTPVSSSTSSFSSSISSKSYPTSSFVPSSSSSAKPTSSTVSSFGIGGIFQQNGTATSSLSWTSPSSTATAIISTSDDNSSGAIVGAASSADSSKSESSAAQGNGAIVGLIVAIIAAACIL